MIKKRNWGGYGEEKDSETKHRKYRSRNSILNQQVIIFIYIGY